MRESPTQNRNVNKIEKPDLAKVENMGEEIKSAQEFFRSKGFAVGEDRLISNQLSETQIEELAKWRKERFDAGGGIEMPTEEDFYRKVYLAASLWRQVQGTETKYLFGKGAGVEIALRGNVQGREKRPVAFPYRTHSDFEFYGVQYEAAENGAYISGEVYPEQFQRVFGGQEYFHPTRTKGMKNLPPDLLHTTAEKVDFGGIELKVPELELLFLDKWLSQESTPRSVNGQVMTDAEVLARQYVLDREKTRNYLQQFVIQPILDQAEKTLQKETENHLRAVPRLLRMGRVQLEESETPITPEALVEFANDQIAAYAGLPNASVGGISVKYWIPLKVGQINGNGEIVDENLREEIRQKIKESESERLESVRSMTQRLDGLFDSVESTQK
jgi:hypothetical protein